MVDRDSKISVDSPEAALMVLKTLVQQGFTEVWARRSESGEVVRLHLDLWIETPSSVEIVQKIM